MIGILLFLILVVLLYATGLLPGIMKAISGFLALVLVLFAASAYGWPLVIGGFVAAIALAAFGVWLADFSSSHSVKARSNRNNVHRQLEKINAEEKRKREREFEKQKAIQEQVDRTDSIGKN